MNYTIKVKAMPDGYDVFIRRPESTDLISAGYAAVTTDDEGRHMTRLQYKDRKAGRQQNFASKASLVSALLKGLIELDQDKQTERHEKRKQREEWQAKRN